MGYFYKGSEKTVYGGFCLKVLQKSSQLVQTSTSVNYETLKKQGKIRCFLFQIFNILSLLVLRCSVDESKPELVLEGGTGADKLHVL